MAQPLERLNWTDVRAFVAVAQTGSLSAAARRLDLSQPTIGRQVQSLETALAAALFTRQPRGMALSRVGERLLPHAVAMMEAASRLTLAAAGEEAEVAGTVRLTASVVLSHYVLPRILAEIRLSEPLIQIELVPSDTTESLLFREADIAVRMYRPEQLEVITQHLGDIALGAFAATDYLDRRGRPQSAEEIFGHDLVGLDRSDRLIRGMHEAGWDLRPEDFALRTDNQTVYWELVRAGCGIGFGQRRLGLADPLLEPVLTDLPMPRLPVWLTTHAAMRRIPRIERVWLRLQAALRDHVD